MTAKPTQESPAREAGADLLRDDEEVQRRSVEAEPAPPADAEGSRTADALAYGGGALVLFGLLALAFTWLASLWGIVALLGIAGVVALALCWATRRLRPPAVSDVLAGIAAISLTLCVDTVFDASGVVVGPDMRWFLVCVPAMLVGGAISWWFRSRAAGATVLGGVDGGPGLVMGVLVLSLSFATFAPFVQRLPNHFSVRAWLRMIWFTGFCASCAFAFAPGVWPVAGGLWAAGVIVLAAIQRRVPAMVLAALALFVVFIVTVIEMFGAITGTGFGTIFFGITLLGVVVAWRQWVGAERIISSS
ncbi:hypothetical protein [Candidatus Poriferisodalis sp.]|uniref:hypothetical protein n=1 Tax=Candidatus Poriferisodalis sp. TaxID=3101277 RepID=UPI003B01B7B1